MTREGDDRWQGAPAEFERYLDWLVSSPRAKWDEWQLKTRLSMLYDLICDDDRRIRQPQGQDVDIVNSPVSRQHVWLPAEEFNACIDVYCDFYERIYGIDLRQEPSPAFDEYLGACRPLGDSQRVGDGVWGARLLKALHELYDGFDEAGRMPEGMFDGSMYRHQQAMLDDVQTALEGGFAAKEPPMMFLAVRFSEANNSVQPMEMDFDEEAILGKSHNACTEQDWRRQLRRHYLLACRGGSAHALLYVAWLLDTGCESELFAKDAALSQRFLAQARALGGPLEEPLFPELSFMEDEEYDIFSVTDALVFYEELYDRPLGKYPQPKPGWNKWLDFLLEFDEMRETWLGSERARQEPGCIGFEAWCAERGMLVRKEAPEEG